MDVKFSGLVMLGFLLLSGCIIAPEYNANDCLSFESDGKIGEALDCYHQLALWNAIQKNKQVAVEFCNHLSLVDASSTGRAERNRCFYEIAEIMNDPSLCENIDKKWSSNDPDEIASISKIFGYFYKNDCKKNAIPSTDPCASVVFVVFPLSLLLFRRV